MARPEQPLPRRRRQILDDETGGAHHFNAREYEDTWVQGETWAYGDAWVKNFIVRLAALVRSIGGKN
jgi:hypothetical protein